MKKIYSGLLLAALVGAAVSCGDKFLTQLPPGSYDQSTINTPAGVRTTLIGAYSLVNGSSGMVTDPMQGLFGSIRGGEAHKGSTTGDQPQMIEVQRFEMTSGNSSASSFFTFHYNAIFRANLVLQALAATPSFPTAEGVQVTAEARFLRAHYHFQLKRLFKNVPFIDETAIDTRVANTNASGGYVEIWPDILKDFEFAMNNLAATNADPGRPNKWAAQAYYAKALLYAASDGVDATTNYNKALTLMNGVIASGVTNKNAKYALTANYHENFDAAKENGTEWVWGAQNSILDGSSATGANGNQFVQYTGDQSGKGPGLCSCYGFFNPSQWFVNHFRTTAAGLPILDDASRNSIGITSYSGAFNATTFVPDSNPIDPRLDWAVGRVTVPYLDFGTFDPSWVRAPDASSVYLSKKQFTRKSEGGVLSAGSANAMNAAVIRYSDVLLMAAELEARVGSLTNAMALVNQVRNRMATNTGNAENWVKKADGTNAANYVISVYPAGSPAFATKDAALAAILMERTLELGLEGHRAYDLIRFGNAGDKEGTDPLDVAKFNKYIAFESGLRGYLAGGLYTKSPDQLAPFPSLGISYSFKDGAVTLKQNPGY